MKNLNDKEIKAIVIIIFIIFIYGFKKALNILNNLKILGLNLWEIAFCGTISFVIVGLIMTISNALFGIWYGKKGGAILYAITFYLIGHFVF